MDIKALPAGALCLVDANVFIYHFGALSAECTDFLARVARREVEAHVTANLEVHDTRANRSPAAEKGRGTAREAARRE